MNDQILHLRNEMGVFKNLLAALTQSVIPQLEEGNAYRTAPVILRERATASFFLGGMRDFVRNQGTWGDTKLRNMVQDPILLTALPLGLAGGCASSVTLGLFWGDCCDWNCWLKGGSSSGQDMGL